MKAKVLIVGGGAMGTCIALHAATRCDPLREPVILLEKDRLGAGSSGRSGAIVHVDYHDREMAGMARDALKVYANFERSTGRSVGFRRTGVLVLAGPGQPSTLTELEANMEMQTSIGIQVKRVEAEEIRSLVPGIEVDDGVVGAFETGGGYVDAARTISAFATMARSRGAITRIGVHNPEVLIKDGRAVGVATDSGVFEASHVVLATGAWTPKITAKLGLKLPLRCVRQDQAFIRMPEAGALDGAGGLLEDSDAMSIDFETRFRPDPFAGMPVAHPVIIDHELGFHAHCEARGQRTRIGRLGFDGSELQDPDADDEATSVAIQGWARELMESRLPAYKDVEDAGTQSTWITLTPDSCPIVGPVDEIPGLFVAAGFSGNDFHLAPSIGEGLAQMLWEQPVSAFNPSFLSPGRF